MFHFTRQLPVLLLPTLSITPFSFNILMFLSMALLVIFVLSAISCSVTLSFSCINQEFFPCFIYTELEKFGIKFGINLAEIFLKNKVIFHHLIAVYCNTYNTRINSFPLYESFSH